MTLTNHILAKKILIHLRVFLNAAQNPADHLGHNFKITVYFTLEKNTQNYEKSHLVDASNIDVFICNFFLKNQKKVFLSMTYRPGLALSIGTKHNIVFCRYFRTKRGYKCVKGCGDLRDVNFIRMGLQFASKRFF